MASVQGLEVEVARAALDLLVVEHQDHLHAVGVEHVESLLEVLQGRLVEALETLVLVPAHGLVERDEDAKHRTKVALLEEGQVGLQRGLGIGPVVLAPGPRAQPGRAREAAAHSCGSAVVDALDRRQAERPLRRLVAAVGPVARPGARSRLWRRSLGGRAEAAAEEDDASYRHHDDDQGQCAQQHDPRRPHAVSSPLH